MKTTIDQLREWNINLPFTQDSMVREMIKNKLIPKMDDEQINLLAKELFAINADTIYFTLDNIGREYYVSLDCDYCNHTTYARSGNWVVHEGRMVFDFVPSGCDSMECEECGAQCVLGDMYQEWIEGDNEDEE